MQHHHHSPYIAMRDTIDNGFSKGWGFHFQPSEEYVIDCHTHCRIEGGKAEIIDTLDRWFNGTEVYRQQKLVALVENREQFPVYQQVVVEDTRLHWMYYCDINEPDLEAVKEAVACGACGLKLHNHKIMMGQAPFDIWEQPAWQDVFAYLNEIKMPILWHVTQRVGYSPYHGGGLNSYFSEGQAKGIHVTNEMLLDHYCSIMDRYPNIPMIGAHQLYVSIDRIAELFERYPQLNIDSTVGFFMRWCDTIYEEDRLPYYDFFVRYADRILFGTDTILRIDSVCPYQIEGFASHLRFIHQLRLPHDVLQKVCYQNSERILKLPPSDSSRKYCSRP